MSQTLTVEDRPAVVQKERRKVTIPTLYEMKANKEPITWLTAYDYPTALLMDRAGIEMILVGDSGGMTMLGYPTTLPVTMDQMVTFTAAVSRAVEYAFVVGDMPYMSYQVSVTEAIRNAGRLMSEGERGLRQARGRRADGAGDRRDHGRRHPGDGAHRPDPPVGVSAGRLQGAGPDRGRAPSRSSTTRRSSRKRAPSPSCSSAFRPRSRDSITERSSVPML